MKVQMFSLAVLLFVQTATAFTASLARRKGSALAKRKALIYMPDGEVVQDDQDDDWMTTEQPQSNILEYLNTPDFRGPLAVLAAAQENIDITTIVHVQAKAVTQSNIQIEAVCASDPENCVNVLACVDFPVQCKDEAEIVQTLNDLHQQASAVLEQKKRELEDAALDEQGIPSWWEPAPTEVLIDEYTAFASIINEWFLDDLRELVIRHKSTKSKIDHAAIVDIGQRGIIVQTSLSRSTTKIPIEFPYKAMDMNSLKNAVLDTLMTDLPEQAVIPSFTGRRQP